MQVNIVRQNKVRVLLRILCHLSGVALRQVSSPGGHITVTSITYEYNISSHLLYLNEKDQNLQNCLPRLCSNPKFGVTPSCIVLLYYKNSHSSIFYVNTMEKCGNASSQSAKEFNNFIFFYFKGIVHPQILILLQFTQPQVIRTQPVWMYFFCWTHTHTKYILRM